MTRNNELKQYAKQKKVELWRVAERFGFTDSVFSRKLRQEFNPEDAKKFRNYVDEIAKEGA